MWVNWQHSETRNFPHKKLIHSQTTNCMHDPRHGRRISWGTNGLSTGLWTRPSEQLTNFRFKQSPARLPISPALSVAFRAKFSKRLAGTNHAFQQMSFFHSILGGSHAYYNPVMIIRSVRQTVTIHLASSSDVMWMSPIWPNPLPNPLLKIKSTESPSAYRVVTFP